jgi:glycerate dehydrogenase
MAKIVFLEQETMGPSVDLFRPGIPHTWTAFDTTSQDQLVERLDGAEIAVFNKAPIGADALQRLPALKFIAVAATGYDNIDLNACRAHGVTVSNVRDYAVDTVAEHTFSLILALSKNLIGYRQGVIEGKWQESGQFCYFSHEIRSLRDARLAIFGGVVIGKAVGRIGTAFGMDVVFAGRKGETAKPEMPYVTFDEAIETADVVTVHAPLTNQTRDLIGKPEFERMTRRPIIVNCGRGGLVNEEALVSALENGIVSSIGIDVLTTEPPSETNPLLTVADREDVIITPHIGWATNAARQEVWRQVVELIEAFAGGSPVRILT